MSYNGIGNCYLKMGDFVKALDYYQKATDINPNNKFAYNGLGVVYEIVHHDD